MSPFSAYIRYISIKNHFTNKKYNCLEYNYKVKASKQSFEKRNDKNFFYKLSNHIDINGFLTSLFIRNPELWVGDIIHGYEQAEKIYREWKGRVQSLEYNFKRDCRKLDLKTCLKVYSNQHPEALRAMIRGDIAPESLVILVHITGALNRWQPKLSGDIIFEQYDQMLRKYNLLLKYDLKHYKKILKEILQELND